jgi:hypothetical protein
VIYVYGIFEGRMGSARGARGIAGAPLRALSVDGVCAAYSDNATPGLEVSEEALWRHEEVVEQLMGEHAVLPLRFGSTLAGEPELRELLEARHSEFAAALRAVRGRVEIGVRASADEPVAEQPAPEDGRAYLEGKLARRRAAADIGEQLHAELAARACASTFKLLAEPRPAFSGAYLVERERVAEFRRAVDALRRARPGVEVACTGPWPPFNFTELMERA